MTPTSPIKFCLHCDRPIEGAAIKVTGADQLAAPSGARGGRLPARQGRSRMPVAAMTGGAVAGRRRVAHGLAGNRGPAESTGVTPSAAAA
ncbi:hypothetical protein GCM10010289_41840 [Streptomyces violascens]|uniref:Uncharacterized protein n=1 Tax=Streptomyces violascens TaxID=67381 RepID=A0ABQ3QZL4_9ACTN|nr:hypothetical protein GCM10010289_41840 [Streptomyces violascens]GHI42713.1 hypothetical protein Sviol_71210 [Streptomyces violascens]